MKFWRFIPFILALAACGGPPPPPVVYKPLDYSYLPPIFLKVANVSVQNIYVPDEAAAALLGQAPEVPANALMDMASRRLVASGAPGTAAFTVETASIYRSGDSLTGNMQVRLDVASADNRNTGFTEASATYSEAAPDSDNQEKMRAALYDLTKQLMDEMNVQLQYQIQHNLGSWVSYSSNAAAAPLNSSAPSEGGIQATPLTSPSAVPDTGSPASGSPPSLVPANVPSMIPPGYPPLTNSP